MRIIKIYLTDDIPTEDKDICCFTAQSLKEAINRKDNYIVTTQTHAFTSWLYKDNNDSNMYEDIILINNSQQLSIKDVLSGKYDKYLREIKTSHNWEKMLYSGIFWIPGVWTWEF